MVLARGERLPLRSKLEGLDRGLLLSALCLTGIGLILIYSAHHAQGGSAHFERQLYFVVAGLVLLAVAAAIPGRVYYAFAYLIYGIALLGLLLVPLAGAMGFGARRWLTMGGLYIQPSEPAKLALIIAVSRVFAYRRHPYSGWKMMWMLAALCLPPMALVALQPNLGTATVFPVLGIALLAWFGLGARFFVLLFMPLLALLLTVSPWIVLPLLAAGFIWLMRSGVRWLGITALVLLCVAATFIAPAAWHQLEPYQQKRLTTFLNPGVDPLGSGYQVIQSKVAIGSGGLTGRGFLKGTQTQLRFLPQQHTDFIFALAGEEFGFFGTSMIIILFLMLGWRGFSLAARAKNQFMGLVAAGVTTMMMYHAGVNIGMAIGLLPVTGLPLPFISYGGSFLITCLVGTGLLLSVGLHRKE